MDGVTREQRKKLRAIEDELEDVKKKLGRIWRHIETTDTAMADASDRIREHRDRQERLEYFAEQARADLAQRRKVLDNANTIAAYAKDMKDFLNESELTERRAFIQSFIKEIIVVPGDALLRYTVPMPDDSLIPGRSAEKVALNGSVLPTLPDGGPECTVLSPSHKANLPGAGNFGFPVSAGVMDLCAVCKALSPAVTHATVTMTRRKIMRRDFWDKLYCELFYGSSPFREGSQPTPDRPAQAFSPPGWRLHHPHEGRPLHPHRHMRRQSSPHYRCCTPARTRAIRMLARARTHKSRRSGTSKRTRRSETDRLTSLTRTGRGPVPPERLLYA